MEKLITYLLRKHLKLAKYQNFYFVNQACKSDRYYFTSNKIIKQTPTREVDSGLSFNYLLSDKCQKQIRRENDGI